MKKLFNSHTLWFEWLRTIGHAPFGSADIGECLAIADKIDESNLDTWYEEWNNLGNKLSILAHHFLGKGHIVSAGEAFFRASNYYRAAEFFCMR